MGEEKGKCSENAKACHAKDLREDQSRRGFIKRAGIAGVPFLLLGGARRVAAGEWLDCTNKDDCTVPSDDSSDGCIVAGGGGADSCAANGSTGDQCGGTGPLDSEDQCNTPYTTGDVCFTAGADDLCVGGSGELDTCGLGQDCV